jgi:peptide/nickel transport system permease protein
MSDGVPSLAGQQRAELSQAASRRDQQPGTWTRLRRSLLSSRTGLLGTVIVLLVVVAAVFTPYLAPADPNQQQIMETLQPPAWLESGSDALLGTDYLGRDILSRIIYGARVSLIIGLSAVAIAGVLGSVLGILAGFQGGWADSIIMRLADFQLSVPFIVLAIAVLGILGPSLRNIIVVLGITGWVVYARVVRSEVLAVRGVDYITAARAIGSTDGRIMVRHILPNVAAPMIVISSLEVARMIISEAALSFLGLGVPPTTPSWGGMVADGRNYLQANWWIATFPGLAIVITVLGINLFGDWLRDALDPRLRGRES